ncbi:hypothetical protein [Corynebacterium argentoratense]|uniref:hypothetical protein n=1 Tax=Corynebacterium argentoratense TaxID=42817 RepID=UPI001F196688|nr:hypothetical protein [Corynebacterium argentoratense]MCF1694293.1 hypothetical protein [Corynebacterium argentoratense]MCF1735864.1 hypothetical protein [Corynebacterium argentoratense]
MNVLENNDLRTLFDRYGLDYRAEPDPGYGAATTLTLNCIGADDAILRFHDGKAVLDVLVDQDISYVPQYRQDDYVLRIRMPIWMAEYIAHATTNQQKEES